MANLQKGEGEARLARLRQLVQECRGDVADAVRGLMGMTTAELAYSMGLPRQSVEQCLKEAYGRRYPHVRVALDMALGLPPGSMNEILAAARPREVAH